MDKTIRWNVDPKEQQAETYRYWQSVPVGERLSATSELSIVAYSLKGPAHDVQGLPRHLIRLERRES
jgi:hypothetical protein